MARTVLIVDDSRTVVHFMKRILENAGLRVLVAYDGASGLSVAETKRPDLVLLDFVMPGMNGLQFAKQLRAIANLESTPIVLVSAKADKIGEAFVAQTRAADVLGKPFSKDALLAVVTHALAKADANKYDASDDDEDDYATTPGERRSVDEITVESTKRFGSTENDLRAGVSRKTLSDTTLTGLYAPRDLAETAAAREHASRKIAEVLRETFVPKNLAPEFNSEAVGAKAIEEFVLRHDALQTHEFVLSLLQSVEAQTQVSLTGSIADVALADVLQMLGGQKQTGMLEVRSLERAVWICFSEGLVDLAIGRTGESQFYLRRYLRTTTSVEPKVLDAAIDVAVRNKHLIGAHLLSQKLVSPEELQAALSLQTSGLVYETLRWRRGNFRFFRYMTRPEASAAKLGLPISRIVMEGLRRVDEWRLIETELGTNFDVVLRKDLETLRQLDAGSLQVEERDVLALVDGERNIREVVVESGLDAFVVCRVLHQFLSARVLRKT